MTTKVKNLPPLLEVLNPTKKYTMGAKMIEQTICGGKNTGISSDKTKGISPRTISRNNLNRASCGGQRNSITSFLARYRVQGVQ